MTVTEDARLRAKLYRVFFACFATGLVVVGFNLLLQDHLPYWVRTACFYVVAAVVLAGGVCVLALQALVIRGWLKSRSAP